MLTTLYPMFQKWSEKGSVYLISDTHFDDENVHRKCPEWPAPETIIEIIKKKARKNDTIIHLGDVGNTIYLEQAWPEHKRPHLVLIMGNHDESVSRFQHLFDEIYTGPLFIAEKILLSHERIPNINFCLNIHGHEHEPSPEDAFHMNIASNVVEWKLINLKDVIQSGRLNKINSIHRQTINKATKRLHKKNKQR